MRIAVCTWNAAALLNTHNSLDVSNWWPEASSSSSAPSEPPAIYVIGFQETVLLPAGLLGTPVASLVKYDKLLKREVEKHAAKAGAKAGAAYSLVAKSSKGALTTFVYAADSIRGDIHGIQKASVGFGDLALSNKSATAIRFKLTDSNTTWTFVNAHLAAHDYNVNRRNADWKALVQRLLFSGPKKQSQIYDTSYLFVLGDLNYRIYSNVPKYISSAQLRAALSDLKTLATERDQLTLEQAEGRTLQGLQEGDVHNFNPTYKYIIGKNEYKAFFERTPGWCDRILFAGNSRHAISVVEYSAVDDVVLSDHKPVVGLYDVALPTTKSEVAPKLLAKSPYKPSSTRGLKALQGIILDRVVGILWCFLHCVGLGNIRLGLIVLAALGGSAYYLEQPYIPALALITALLSAPSQLL